MDTVCRHAHRCGGIFKNTDFSMYVGIAATRRRPFLRIKNQYTENSGVFHFVNRHLVVWLLVTGVWRKQGYFVRGSRVDRMSWGLNRLVKKKQNTSVFVRRVSICTCSDISMSTSSFLMPIQTRFPLSCCAMLARSLSVKLPRSCERKQRAGRDFQLCLQNECGE